MHEAARDQNMSFRLHIWLLAILMAMTGCKEHQATAHKLLIEIPKDPHAGFGDFLSGLAYMVEQEPLTLKATRNGNPFEITVYSMGHEHSPIEPLNITLTQEGLKVGGKSEHMDMEQLGKTTLDIFVKGCEAAKVEPILLVLAADGISLDQGLELLEFLTRNGVNAIVVPDETYTGPVPRLPLREPKRPSTHPPTPPHIDHSTPLRTEPSRY